MHKYEQININEINFTTITTATSPCPLGVTAIDYFLPGSPGSRDARDG